jgi:uncharacterized protein YjdB
MIFSKNKKVLSAFLSLIMIGTIGASVPFTASADTTDSTVGVTYRTDVQSNGWQDYVSNGTESGTEGMSLRVEALNIKLVGAPAGASINYQAYVQGIGWQSTVSNGAEAGTEGESKRIEAIKITLSGLDGYEVQYQVHEQTYGTTDWVTTTNGTAISDTAYAGTVGQSKRIEAIWIKLVKTNGGTATSATVSSINPVNVNTIAGTAPDLPSTVTATMSNGTTKNYGVTWDYVYSSQYASAGKFTVNGTISASSTIKANATVNVISSSASDTVSTINPISVTTIAGTAPDLPSTVIANMSDGTTQNCIVTWDVDASQYASAGGFTVYGTISASSTITATAIVTVLPSSTSITVQSISPITVTTTKGIAPDLPSTVTATMSDGTTKNFGVTWVYIDSTQYENYGTFTVTGLISTSTTIEAKATVLVILASTATTVESINPISVTTIAGTAPDLQSTVSANMSDGTTKNYGVTWDSVDASQYASSGTFTVTGTISESSTITATAKITVK